MSTHDDPAVAELARRMPWTVAEPESWWLVTGTKGPLSSFHDCVAECLPPFVTGLPEDGTRVFNLLSYGGEPDIITASQITAARELIFVMGDDPLTTYADRDQPIIDRAVAARAETRTA